MVSASCLCRSLLIASLLITAAQAQRNGGNGGSRPAPPGINPPAASPRINTTPDNSTQPIFVSGRVVLEGGGPLTEPVAIERICNGGVHREGYTDYNGRFQLQLGLNTGFQDASEDSSRSGLTIPKSFAKTGIRSPLMLNGCEFRANLAGYQSTIVPVRDTEDEFGVDLGTIVLKRLGDAKGAVISATSMAAPKKAREAYEKSLNAMQKSRFDEERKQLEKAVDIYPQFATAWSMLGDLEQKQHHLEEAKQAYQRSLNADPQYVKPLFGLAALALEEKNWQDVARFTEQTANLNAYAFPLVFFFNGLANFNLRQFDKAEESARKYIMMDKGHQHPEAGLLLANILVQKHDFAGAAQEIHHYLELVPDATDAERLKSQAKALETASIAKKQ